MYAAAGQSRMHHYKLTKNKQNRQRD